MAVESRESNHWGGVRSWTVGGEARKGQDLPWVMSKQTLGSEESGNLSQSKALLRLNLEVMNSWQVEATAGSQKVHKPHKDPHRIP